MTEVFEQVNHQLEKRVRELRILHGIGKAVASVRDLEELLNRIVEAAVYLTGAEEGFLLLIDEETDELYMRAGKDLGKKFATGFRVKSDDSLSWQVVQTGKPIMISSVTDEERFKLKTGYLVKALLHVPLKLRKEVIGVLSVDNKIARRGFTDNDLQLLSALADYAAIAIDNVQQYERAEAEATKLAELLEAQTSQPPPAPEPTEGAPQVEQEPSLLTAGFEQINHQLQKRVRELRILHGIGKAVASVRDLEKLLNRIVEAAVYLTGAEEGFLLLIDEETDELYMRAGKDLGKKFATGFRVKSEDSLSWQVVQTGKPIMISSVTDEERFKLKTGYLVKALLHVPLRVRKEIIGVLSVDNKIARREFTADDLQLLSALADYAAIAIDNVQQYERAEAEATKLAELLVAQASKAPAGTRPTEGAPQVVPIDWLAQELQTQQKVVEEGLRETEKLARELTAQVSAVEQLAERWRNQRTESKELTRRLTAEEVAAVGGSGGIWAAILPNFQEIVGNLGDGLIITDDRGIVTLANEAARHLLGSDQIVGRDLRWVTTTPHWARSVHRLENMRTPDKTEWQDVTLWNEDRLIKASFLSLSEQEEENGQWAVILRDLGRERAVQSAREKLTSVISQELRTPMTILTSYTDLLLAEVVGLLVPVQRRVLEVMRDNLTRASATMNNLMTVLPLVIKEEDGALWTVDLHTVVEQALADAAPWFRDKDLRVELDVVEDLPQAAAEPDCVYQMVANLLQNAGRATPPRGTIVVRAGVGERDSPDGQLSHLVISVQDQGGGIAPQFLGQVFERFYSEEEQPIPGLGGRGAELSLVKKLVEVFGGRVWVETEPGVGSTFSFVLPAIEEE